MRRKPLELQVFEYISRRKSLSEAESNKYRKLRRGYEGEVLFESYVTGLSDQLLSIGDIWLSCNGKFFQIDHLLFGKNTIYLYEIKNFPGEYYYENDKLYVRSGKLMDDPLTQLQRCETLFAQLLEKLRVHVPIQAAVVFVNPECTLFQAPLSSRIILPTQLNYYFKQFQESNKLHPTFNKLAEKLNTIRLAEPPYQQLPEFHYQELKKGIPCKWCHHFCTREGKLCHCANCGQLETVQSAIMRMVTEFKTLYPEEPVTRSRLLDWCENMVTTKQISYTLQKHFNIEGTGRGSHYVESRT
ncbi:nuclease-related domain-containing protein [Gracilibacillus salinarum]|uniref:NERD domain-containing protein n=1 Tax=Gracilibacillus salinarum TaxID=2932255 RepID=A0ABY4GT10_9BACI|nr:nuclease-related domain-containing protein [Gracilibacillus salinarum]UOQ86807.1 NERD domain-containing protein [Gracilibacillus salinarum]